MGSNNKKKTRKSNTKGPTATQRIAALESHVAFLAGAQSPDGPSEARPLIFTLEPGGPTKVQLTLDYTEPLILGSGPVSSAPRADHALVHVMVELWGTGGQQAVIDVENGSPDKFSSTIPKGESYWKEPRTLRAEWQ